jgi:ORF6N domain-containing protein
LCPALRCLSAEGFRNYNRQPGMTKHKDPALMPIDHIAQSIVILRGQRVLLDSDLAALYGVETRRLNEQVRRNHARFPADFIFELTSAEFGNLKSQIATSSWGGRRKRPLAFTEHGAIMTATVLNSARAVEMTIYVVRAFVQLRDLLGSNRQLADKFAELERKVSSHDEAIVGILKAIRELMRPPVVRRRPIGFTANLDESE